MEPWVVPDGTVATGLELMLKIFLNKFDPGSDLILGWISSWVRIDPGSDLILGQIWSWIRIDPGSDLILGQN